MLNSNLTQVLQLVSPAFLVIGLGFLYNRIFKQDVEPLATASMTLLVPAFAFVHLYRMDIQGDLMSTVFLSAWIIILLPGVLAWLLFSRGEGMPRGLYLPVLFMNTVNLPFPILLAAYGETAFPYALMFYLASILGVFTLGMLIASSGKGSWQILKEPVLYAICLALWMNSNDVDIPELLVQPIALLEAATIPLVLLILGMQLGRVRVTQWKWPLMAAGLRFGGGISAALICVVVFSLDGLARKIVILESIMPSAIICALIAEKYQTDADPVASTVFLTTLLSVILIPLALFWLG